MVVDRADNGWPGAAYDVTAPTTVFLSSDRVWTVSLRDPSAPTIDTEVINPNVSSYVVFVVVPVSSVDKVTRPWSS